MDKTRNKIKYIPKFPFFIIISICLFGILILYSINSGSFYPWGFRQLIRLAIGIGILLSTISIPINFWKKYSYLFYSICIILLISVIIIGKINMGAQRWLKLYSFNFQPSELMRVFLIIVLARYFSNSTVEEIKCTYHLIAPLILVALPMALVLLQPDLGTAILFACCAAVIFFVAGVQIWKFITVIGICITSLPFIWNMLYDYQKNRLLMFLSPEKDPSGAGYHIIQSKIALGSGGIFGKGLAHGTQCQLNFLPEKQTDFVFAALGEELGLMGCLTLILLYSLLIIYNFSACLKLKDRFTQLLVFGLNAMLFFYTFINISMVCGLLPVVGIPLPFFSYGGSALVVIMFSQGLIFSADIENTTTTYYKH